MGKRLTSEQRKAFAGMLQPHHEYLARFCARLARTDEDGQDLYQQAILKALVKLGSLREDGRFRQWMCSIIVNEHRSRCRKERVRRLFQLTAWKENGNFGLARHGSAASPDDVEQTVRLRQCLQHLSAAKREAMILFEVEGFSLAEVAGIQRCSVDAVKTRLSRARKELRRLFVGCGNGRSAAPRPTRQEKGHAFEIKLEARD